MKSKLQQDYTKNGAVVQLVLPLATEVLIPADDSVRLLSLLLEELDYRKLYQAYSPFGRKPAVSPKNLFKVLVYGYMNNIYTSRALETACRRDINFMWLLQGQKGPDHNTIARFRSERLKDAVEDLFYQLTSKLFQLGEIACENLYVDGTKIEACANKYTFVWKKTTAKNEAKLQIKVKQLLVTLGHEIQEDYVVTLEDMLTVHKKLSQIGEEQGLEFVHGKGKHKTQLQRDIETLEDYIARQQKYNCYNALFNGRNSFSKTDPDATFMHMKDDHMRNSQLKPGYNVQIGVEAEYIVGIDISSERSDSLTLIPFLEKMGKACPHMFTNVIADAGYESEENYEYLQARQIETYIKPANYETMRTPKGKSKIGRRENMIYDEKQDVYICKNGQVLKPVGNQTRTSKSGYISKQTVYECESCEDCPLKPRCTKAKGNKRLDVSKRFVELRAKSHANITSPKGILLRLNRSIQVEGAFGVLKEDYGFRRFLMRGQKNVKIEFLLLSIGYNINKLHSKIQNNRCGQLIHEKTVA
ncbi:MAG TPA: IS1182 family transposase [Firmicutes bacterium]|nr:IS1182 family transposase [Bacillota bacterium]